MSNSEIAMNLTLKAMEEGYIPKKSINLFDGEDQFTEATKYAAAQVGEFYQRVLDAFNEIQN